MQHELKEINYQYHAALLDREKYTTGFFHTPPKDVAIIFAYYRNFSLN